MLAAGLVPPLLLIAAFWRMVEGIAGPGLRDAIAVRNVAIFWMGGLLARAGNIAVLFDPPAFQAAMEATFGTGFISLPWAYPPPTLFLAVPASFLSLKGSFLAWSIAGSALFWLGARAAGLDRTARLAALLSPAAIENVLSGQNGSLTAALMLPGFLLLNRSPWVAGTLLGGLILKPQLAILVPLCLLASRNWRAAAGAALSASAIGGASALAFGWASWAEFLRTTAPFMRRAMLEADWFNGPYQSMIVTPFMAARWAGAPTATAYLVQAICALGAGLVCWRAWRRPGADPLARAALTLALTFLASPYLDFPHFRPRSRGCP